MESRKCKRCGEDKPLEDYPKNAACKGGRTPVCKTCTYAQRTGEKPQTPASTRRAAKTGRGKVHQAKRSPAQARKAKPSKAPAIVPTLISPEVADELTALLDKLFAIAEKVTIAKMRDLLDRQRGL